MKRKRDWPPYVRPRCEPGGVAMNDLALGAMDPVDMRGYGDRWFVASDRGVVAAAKPDREHGMVSAPAPAVLRTVFMDAAIVLAPGKVE